MGHFLYSVFLIHLKNKTNTLKNKNSILILIISLAFFIFLFSSYNYQETILSYEVNPKKQEIKLYFKNDKNENLKSILNLKKYLELKNQKLVFATNGGMYKKDNSPVGLFIQDNKLITPLDTTSGNGNFYLKPNGVFYLSDKKEGFISKTENYKNNKDIKFATQSGPMLVIDNEINSVFNKSSSNINIRSGVGILPNGNVLFGMSNSEINFYNFAEFFKNRGCKNALYLDGFVSRTYCPEKNNEQVDGDFGVIIGITRK